jgi:hypothetical protein
MIVFHLLYFQKVSSERLIDLRLGFKGQKKSHKLETATRDEVHPHSSEDSFRQIVIPPSLAPRIANVWDHTIFL